MKNSVFWSLLIGALAATTIVVYQLSQTSENTGDSVSTSPGAHLEKQPNPTLILNRTPITNKNIETSIPQPSVLVVMRERFDDDYDPMMIFSAGDFSDAEIAAYNELHVIPFNPISTRLCLEEVNEWGLDSKSCTNTRLHAPHTYESFEDEMLAELAEHDATAAMILGKRIRDEERKLELHLRAAALSGKPGPLLFLAEYEYRSFTHIMPTSEGNVTAHFPENLIRRLTLETIAAKLGDPRADPAKWRKEIINADFIQDAFDAIEQSDKLTIKWLAQMSTIQANVTGNTQMHNLAEQLSQHNTPSAPFANDNEATLFSSDSDLGKKQRFEHEAANVKREKANQELITRYVATSAGDFHEFAIEQNGDMTVLFQPGTLESLIHDQVDEILGKAQKNKPLSRAEMLNLWQKVKDEQTQMITELKSSEAGRQNLAQVRLYNQQLIHIRDTQRETELARTEGREVNPDNIRYPDSLKIPNRGT